MAQSQATLEELLSTEALTRRCPPLLHSVVWAQAFTQTHSQND